MAACQSFFTDWLPYTEALYNLHPTYVWTRIAMKVKFRYWVWQNFAITSSSFSHLPVWRKELISISMRGQESCNNQIVFWILLTLPAPILDEKKININSYFHTSLGCFKRFSEGLKGLHKTFRDTTKKSEDKNLS